VARPHPETARHPIDFHARVTDGSRQKLSSEPLLCLESSLRYGRLECPSKLQLVTVFAGSTAS
jgi:hypothetical protein